MTTAKIALTIPVEVVRLAKREARSRGAKSLSAFISEAVAEKIYRDELTAILDAMDLGHGKASKADQAWARRVLSRSS